MRKYLFLLFLILSICPSVFGSEVAKQKWAARYNGPDNSNDYAVALAVDNSGNVYVTGPSNDSNGLSDYATIKYDPNGNQLWAARYNGPDNNYDDAVALAINNSGNVYVTGNSVDSNGYSDYTTIKYDSNGNQLWAARYNGSDNSNDYAYDLAVDSSGNVYVTGSSYGSSTENDYATVKYDSGGNEIWAKRYNGPDNGDDGAVALAIDSSDNVYVTGYSFDNSTSYDYATIKYRPNGNRSWVSRYDGPYNNDDYVRDLTIDTLGNIYVTGTSQDINGNSAYSTIKYASNNGNELWAAHYNGPENGYYEAVALVSDNTGNVYVTGNSNDSNGNGEYATVKYGPDGNQLWEVRYNGPENINETAYDIAIDGSGNVYVTGCSYSSDTSWDYATVKYSPNGNQLWVARYNGTSNGDDVASALAIDSSGNVYVTGYGYDNTTYADYTTIKYKQTNCSGPIPGDLNNDCKVDLEDLAIMVSNWLDCNYLPQENCW